MVFDVLGARATVVRILLSPLAYWLKTVIIWTHSIQLKKQERVLFYDTIAIYSHSVAVSHKPA